MDRFILTKVVAAICLTSLLSLSSFSLPRQVQAQDTSGAKEGFPGRRVGGGTRGPEQIVTEKPLIALVPENARGLTTAATPTFFFYVPRTEKPLRVEFVLTDENEEKVYETTFTTISTGVVSIALPTTGTVKPLEIGKNYSWYFAIGVDESDRTADIDVHGSIQRVALAPNLASQLEAATPLNRVALYAANNLWYDAMATLAQLRRSNPNDTAVATQWTQLLQSVKLDDIIQEPLVESQVSMR